MWIISLIAMLFWSGSDLFSKAGSKQTDKYSHYKVGIAVGLIMGIHAIYSITIGGVPFAFSDIITYLPASFFYILSMMLGYIALRYIELSISSPICNTSGALALILSICYFGVTFSAEDESGKIFLNAPIIFGVIMIIIGVLSLGIVDYRENDEARELRQSKSGKKYTKSFIAILLPILYCLIDAVGSFVDTLIADNYIADFTLKNPTMDADKADLLCGDILNTAYEFTWFFMAIIFAIYIFVIKREKIETKYDGTKLLGGLCETLGQVFYMMVVVSDYKVGFVIISSYCAASVLWSRIFLKEKLSLKHYLSIACAFVGIFILGIYDV
ncbi:MAG: hypothetical protein E7582_00830 [Ruminococcaceae bacterium]|nr:hypothetical protein [Oscillospiraceae bacterium]